MLDYLQKPIALTKFEVLQRYMELDSEQSYAYERLQRGYDGKKKLATLFYKVLSQPFHVLYDV